MFAFNSEMIGSIGLAQRREVLNAHRSTSQRASSAAMQCDSHQRSARAIGVYAVHATLAIRFHSLSPCLSGPATTCCRRLHRRRPASSKRQRRRKRCTKNSDGNSDDDDDGSDSDNDSAGSCETARLARDAAALRSDPDMQRRLLEVVRFVLMPEAAARAAHHPTFALLSYRAPANAAAASFFTAARRSSAATATSRVGAQEDALIERWFGTAAPPGEDAHSRMRT